MKVNTTAGQFFDMVQFEIHTGAVYNGQQIVRAQALEMVSNSNTKEIQITFQIADESRNMYEKVNVFATWKHFQACQNDTYTKQGVIRMADFIMDEYLGSRFVA